MGFHCSELFWINEFRTEYLHDSTGVFGPLLPAVSCDEVRTRVTEQLEFDFKLANARLSHMLALAGSINQWLSHLHLTDQPLPNILIQYMTVLSQLMAVAETDMFLEHRMARLKFRRSEEYRSFVWTVRVFAAGYSLIGFASDLRLLERFAPFAALAAELAVGNPSDGIPEIREIVEGFDPRFREKNFKEKAESFQSVAPLDESDPVRAIEFLNRIHELLELSVQVRSALLSGFSISFSPGLQLQLYFEVVRLLAIAESEVSDAPHALLHFSFVCTVCGNLEMVADYIAILARLRYMGSAKIGHGIGTIVRICRKYTSPETRIRVSSVFKGQAFLPAWVPSVWRIHSELYFQDSDSALQDSRLVIGSDLVIIVEGFEHVGFVGQRKQWISKMIDRFFRPGDEYFSQLWEFTDESNRMITIRSDADSRLSFAAGRVMGFAIRYGIPMAVPLSPSFFALINVFSDGSHDLDATLDLEDPAFLRGLDRVSLIDWKDPPEAVKWLTFEDLIPGGENVHLTKSNVELFLSLKKEKKLFGSKTLRSQSFRAGLAHAVGAGLFFMLTSDEVRARVVPSPDLLTAEKLWNGLIFRNFENGNSQHDQLKTWFREIVFSWNPSVIRDFNMFVTGVREPPFGAENEPWIKVFFEPSLGAEKLPRSHTCHNELQLPLFESLDIFRQKLTTAVTETNTVEGYEGYGVD
jgi:hypothetical protein